MLSEKRIKTAATTIPCNLTLNNLFEVWFSDIKLKVKESTYVNYQMKYEKHVKSALGNYAYEKITADKLNDFIQTKLSSGLSAKYTADIAGVIKSVCRFAKKRYGYYDKSEFITMPKGKAKEKSLLGKTEQTTLNNYLTSNPNASNVGILLSATTGIRIGELCALKWGTIDLEKRTLTIKNTVQRIKSIDGSTATKLIITLPKSNSSVRKIPLPDFIIPILRNLKGNNDYYILSGTRAIIEPRTMQYRFKHILSDLNLPNVS